MHAAPSLRRKLYFVSPLLTALLFGVYERLGLRSLKARLLGLGRRTARPTTADFARQSAEQIRLLGLDKLEILSGPFKGMRYGDFSYNSALIPKLLGTYEADLHGWVGEALGAGYDAVINIGCAEGYYAVGLARMMPSATIHAYDIDERARRACAELAAKNDVSDRVIIGGELKPDGFEAFAGRRVLVMVDAEGAEVDILQPALSPALAGMNIIVETHDLFRKGALAVLIQRFAATHDITRVDQQPKAVVFPPWLQSLPHLDQLLAVWEWRAQPTPWLVMRPKSA